MRTLLHFSRLQVFLPLTVAAAGLIALPMHAQGNGFASSGATSEALSESAATATTSAPAGAPSTRPDQVWHDTYVPADKEINAKVVSGMLMVDGLVAKVHLNYDIQHADYMYFFVPGVGTAILSRADMYGSTKVADAFSGSSLSFSVAGHSFELTSEAPLMRTKIVKGKPMKSDAYVRIDTSTVALDRSPMVGFGVTTRAPYEWPMSDVQAADKSAHFVQPPPMPSSVLPRTVSLVKVSAVEPR